MALTRVSRALLADDSVNSDKVADSSINSEHFVDGGIDTVHLADNAVTAAKLASDVAGTGLTSTNGVLSVNATGSSGLQDGAVSTVKLADSAVTTAKIAADAVDGTKIADDSIDSEHYVDGSIDTAHIANDNVTHDKLEARYTAQASITTLTGTVSFDCSTASSFKLSGNLTGAYTINLSNYKKGQVITIYPLQAQSVTLAAQGSSTNTFNKIGGVDYDNTTSSILQIECVDDSSTDPVFFYSIATFASDSTI